MFTDSCAGQLSSDGIADTRTSQGHSGELWHGWIASIGDNTNVGGLSKRGIGSSQKKSYFISQCLGSLRAMAHVINQNSLTVIGQRLRGIQGTFTAGSDRTDS
jgi:hypothetical protein